MACGLAAFISGSVQAGTGVGGAHPPGTSPRLVSADVGSAAQSKSAGNVRQGNAPAVMPTPVQLMPLAGLFGYPLVLELVAGAWQAGCLFTNSFAGYASRIWMPNVRVRVLAHGARMWPGNESMGALAGGAQDVASGRPPAR